MTEKVRSHYETYPYPHYPLIASVRRCDTYALNLLALCSRFNGRLPPADSGRILIAGCGSFSPYPFAISNPDNALTALDLSMANLKRARLHCLLHGIRNVRFCQGNLLDPASTDGQFGLIDAYGVLHHLTDPLEGLKSLAARLTDNGIIRVMVYSRYARKEEESIRRAFRLLGIQDAATVRQLISRSKAGSRLRRYVDDSYEAHTVSGLADALLHPCVKTYKIDEFMEMTRQSGLQPLLFAHDGALADIDDEVSRIRSMESQKRSPGNFLLFLGLNPQGPCEYSNDTYLMLNPCLKSCVSR